MLKNKLIIATRKSKLALWQAEKVKQLLLALRPNLQIELNALSSEGDDRKDLPLNAIGGKDLFVKTIQAQILQKNADVAVHSLKDLSVHDYAGLSLAAFIKRGDPRDAFISPHYANIDNLPADAVVGTASPRRQSLLKARRPDLQIKLLRGNVETRLKKCFDNEFDAIILAAAGLERLGLSSQVKQYLNPYEFVPAIGQGIIAVECRSDDRAMQALLREINDTETEICAIAERAFNKKLGGDCFTPVGAYAHIDKESLRMIGFYGDLDGKNNRQVEGHGDIHAAEQLGFKLAEEISES